MEYSFNELLRIPECIDVITGIKSKIDRNLAEEFTKTFEFDVSLYDIKENVVLIGSNSKLEGPKIKITGMHSQVYQYDIFNDTLKRMTKLETQQSISFLSILDIKNYVMIGYMNNDCLIFDFKNEVEVCRFKTNKPITCCVCDKKLFTVLLSTGNQIFRIVLSQQPIRPLKIADSQNKVICIAKGKNLKTIFLLTDDGKINLMTLISNTVRIIPIKKFSNLNIKSFRFLKKSQYLILELSENEFQVYQVRFEYPYCHQTIFNCINYETHRKNTFDIDLKSETIVQITNDEISSPKIKEKKTSSKDKFPNNSENENSKVENQKQKLNITKIENEDLNISQSKVSVKNNITSSQNQNNENDALLSSTKKFEATGVETISLVCDLVYEKKVSEKIDCWEFCDSSNLIFSSNTDKDSKQLLTVFFTSNNDSSTNFVYKKNLGAESMKICGIVNWLILKTDTKTLMRINLSNGGFHPLGKDLNLIDIFVDEFENFIYMCGGKTIKQWHSISNRVVKSKNLFESVNEKAKYYQFSQKHKYIFASTDCQNIYQINASTLELKQKINLGELLNVSNTQSNIVIHEESDSLYFSVKSKPNLHIWNFENNTTHINKVKTDDELVKKFHISAKHNLILTFNKKQRHIFFYELTNFELAFEMIISLPFPLMFIVELENENMIYFGFLGVLLIFSLTELKIIKELSISNESCFRINSEYLLINSAKNSESLILRIKNTSVVCKLSTNNTNTKIRYCKAASKFMIIQDDKGYIHKKYLSNSTQNISKEISLQSTFHAEKFQEILFTFENKLIQFIGSKQQLHVNDYHISKGYNQLLQSKDKKFLIAIYLKKISLWQTDPWKEIESNLEFDKRFLFGAIFENSRKIFVMGLSNNDLYLTFEIFNFPPFSKHSEYKIEFKNSIPKFSINFQTEIVYYCEVGDYIVFKYDYKSKIQLSKFFVSEYPINSVRVSEVNNWVFVILVDPLIVVIDEASGFVIQIISDIHNINRAILLNENQNILVSMNDSEYQIWELSTLKLVGKFSFGSNIRNLFWVDIKSRLKEIRSIQIEVPEGQKPYLCIQNYSEIHNCSFIEQIFLRQFFYTNLAPKIFLQRYREMKQIYRTSFILKKYFNIYLLAAIQNNEQLFDTLYEVEKEPFEFLECQINPLQLIIAKNQNEKLKMLFNFIQKNQLYIPIDQNSFRMLLKRKDKFGFEYLSKAYSIINTFQVTETSIPLETFIKQAVTIINSHLPYYTEVTHKQFDLVQNSKTLSEKIFTYFFEKQKSSIVIHNLYIQWDFSPFTQHSLEFLEAYYHNKYDEFILSPYSYIIFSKWNNLYYLFCGQAFFYWTHMILYYIFLLNRTESGYFWADLSILVFIFLYEIVSISADWRHYKKDKWNIFDWVALLLCLAFLILNKNPDLHEYRTNIWWIIFQNLSIFFVGIRGFSFFKFLPSFSHIALMSAGMIKYSMTIVILISYCILCFSILIANTNSSYDYLTSISTIYNLLFGNLPEWNNEEGISAIYVIVIIIGSMILPIFFMNFLIAQLSSAYNNLEQRQLILALKEMAFSIYEWETIIRFIKKICKIDQAAPKFEHVFLIVDKQKLLKNQVNSINEDILRALEKIPQEISTLSTKIDVLINNKAKAEE